MLRSRHPPEFAARGTALGLMLAFTPTIGLHTLLATGRIGDLETSWRITGGKGGSLFDLTIGLLFASIVIVAMLVVIAFVMLPAYVGDLGFVALPAMTLAIPVLLRTLQLSAFVERYFSLGAEFNDV